MPHIRDSRILPWSAEQMFDLVADVGRYAEFLPWVIATRVRSDGEREMVADVLVGFNHVREKFTSRVCKQRPERIDVDYVDGPMRTLDTHWYFDPLPEGGGCAVTFWVEFSFRSPAFEKLAGTYLDRAFRRMVSAFQSRADALYGGGSSSSSATSAA